MTGNKMQKRHPAAPPAFAITVTCQVPLSSTQRPAPCHARVGLQPRPATVRRKMSNLHPVTLTHVPRQGPGEKVLRRWLWEPGLLTPGLAEPGRAACTLRPCPHPVAVLGATAPVAWAGRS